jgi:hypothetical protein
MVVAGCLAGRNQGAPGHEAKQQKTTPVGFEPTRGDPVGLAGGRPNRPAKASLVATYAD